MESCKVTCTIAAESMASGSVWVKVNSWVYYGLTGEYDVVM